MWHGAASVGVRAGALLALALLLRAGGAAAQEVDDVPAAAGPASPVAAPEEAPAAPRLTLDLPTSAATSGALLLAAGLAGSSRLSLTPGACRWCEPGRLDRWARGQLRWGSPGRAARASDLAATAVPAGAALAVGLMALHPSSGWREPAEDLLAVTEAVAVATALTQGAKVGFARLRPEPWASGREPSANDLHSFWSGHTSLAFSAAAAATQVARLRGRSGWRWLGLASFAGAAAVGWLRVAGDQHWLTDVLAGAAVGTASGLGVPLLVLRPAGGRRPALTLAPAPGGLALLF